MKRFLAIAALLLLATGQTPLKQVTFVWEYPINEVTDELVFRLYHSKDMTTNSWQVISTVLATNSIYYGTNQAPAYLTNRLFFVTLTVDAGKHFYTATASNFWGESDFSNVVSTPASARNVMNLSVRRGP